MNYCLYVHLISGHNIQVRAHICEVGKEKDQRGIWKWVLPYAEPCKCTSVRMGGMNTRTPIRPFKPTYVSKPLASTDVAKIRKHYRLQCSGKNDIITVSIPKCKCTIGLYNGKMRSSSCNTLLTLPQVYPKLRSLSHFSVFPFFSIFEILI